MSKSNYKEIAKQCRLRVLKMIYDAQVSHIGSNFSCIDIMTVLFEKMDLDKDKFILSKGWAAASLYYFLWRKGRITEKELNSFCQPIKCPFCGIGTKVEVKNINSFKGAKEAAEYEFKRQSEIVSRCKGCSGKGEVWSNFIGLVEPHDCLDCNGIGTECQKCKGSGKRIGLEVGTGSMGLGLPAAVGFALAKKLKGEEGKVYCLMSDGEMQCGTTWESALIANQHGLNNLEIWCDFNLFQAMGLVKDILDIEPLTEKWRAFGWCVYSINGHDFNEIQNVFSLSREKPTIVICKTEKGFPVSFMRGENLFHYKSPSLAEYEQAMVELSNDTTK